MHPLALPKHLQRMFLQAKNARDTLKNTWDETTVMHAPGQIRLPGCQKGTFSCGVPYARQTQRLLRSIYHLGMDTWYPYHSLLPTYSYSLLLELLIYVSRLYGSGRVVAEWHWLPAWEAGLGVPKFDLRGNTARTVCNDAVRPKFQMDPRCR